MDPFVLFGSECVHSLAENKMTKINDLDNFKIISFLG